MTHGYDSYTVEAVRSQGAFDITIGMYMNIFENRLAKPMLIAGESEPFDSEDYSYELKMDGERCLAYLDTDMVDLVNRRDRRVLVQFPELGLLHKQVRKRCILDGELIVGMGRKEDFEAIKQRSLVTRSSTIQRMSMENPCTFVAFDILYCGERLLTDLSLDERHAILRETVRENQRLNVVRSIHGQGVAFFNAVRKEGLEGIIAKRRDSRYIMGKRTREWTKIKNWLEAQFVICGYVPTEKAAVVSLVLGQYNRDGHLVYKGRTTLGIRREDFQAVRQAPRSEKHPFNAKPEVPDGTIWIEPDLVCTVAFMCWTGNLRLRQPNYKGLVIGKPAKQVIEPQEPIIC